MSGSKNAALLGAALSAVTDRTIVTYDDYLLKRNEPANRDKGFMALSIDALHQSSLVGGAVPSDVPPDNDNDNGDGNSRTTQQSAAAGIASPSTQVPATPPPTHATSSSRPPPQNTVHVRMLQGKTITISCNLSDTIGEFKQLIQQQENVPTSRQRLIFAGRQLEDHQTLSHYNIHDGYTMHIIVRATDNVSTIYYIHSDHLSPRYDYDFTNVTDSYRKFMRGAFEYKRPCGWNRIALRVLNAYGIDNSWLGISTSTFRYDSNASEWPVAYHGTAKINDRSLADEARDACGNTKFSFNHGIYSTPDVDIAARYAETFDHEGRQYNVLIQNRVDPTALKRIVSSSGEEYWVVPNGDCIRPYGVCVKRL